MHQQNQAAAINGVIENLAQRKQADKQAQRAGQSKAAQAGGHLRKGPAPTRAAAKQLLFFNQIGCGRRQQRLLHKNRQQTGKQKVEITISWIVKAAVNHAEAQHIFGRLLRQHPAGLQQLQSNARIHSAADIADRLHNG